MADEPTLYVQDSGGDGRPVVLIHGWPLSGASWSEQVPVLSAAGHRVITYDRRGFGRSAPSASGYDYDTLAADLGRVLSERDLRDVTLVGFSMGGGEVARYVSRFGEDRLAAVVFASAVTPFLLQTPDNPDGPLTQEAADGFRTGLENDRHGFFDGFVTQFFSVDGDLKVSEAQRQEALAVAEQSDQQAALACMQAWASTDFREDLARITAPTLVIHGDGDATVPFAGSGARTHEAVAHSALVVVRDAPHGLNVSHAKQFNETLLEFLDA